MDEEIEKSNAVNPDFIYNPNDTVLDKKFCKKLLDKYGYFEHVKQTTEETTYEIIEPKLLDNVPN